MRLIGKMTHIAYMLLWKLLSNAVCINSIGYHNVLVRFILTFIKEVIKYDA